jgi:hypothetical protein
MSNQKHYYIPRWVAGAIGLLIILMLLLFTSCRSVSKSTKNNKTDSTRRTDIQVSQTTTKDTSGVTERKESAGTQNSSEYEKTTVVEEFAKLNSEPSKEPLYVADSCKEIGVFLARRTTTTEKGKQSNATSNTSFQKDSSHKKEQAKKDIRILKETMVVTVNRTTTVTRKVSVWNLLWLLLPAVVYAGYQVAKKYKLI